MAKTKAPDQWQQLADAMGVTVPQAHQQIEHDKSMLAEIGQHPSTNDLIQQIMKAGGANPSQTQLREGAEQYGAYNAQEWAALSPQEKAQAIQQYIQDPNTQYFSPGTQKRVEAEAKSPLGAGVDKPLPDPAKAAASIPESPYQELAQALASEYLNQVNQLMPLTSGSALFGQGGLTNQVVGEAASMIPGGGGWLQQQAAAEQKAAAPLQAAMSQVGEAQAQGAIPYAGAIANTGTANTAYLEAAPWQQILSELASETAYKAASTQGAAAFGLTPQNTPAFLNQILQSHGLTGTAALGGLQPVGKAAAGGQKSSVPSASTSPNG